MRVAAAERRISMENHDLFASLLSSEGGLTLKAHLDASASAAAVPDADADAAPALAAVRPRCTSETCVTRSGCALRAADRAV